jgi:hypothetical protein
VVGRRRGICGDARAARSDLRDLIGVNDLGKGSTRITVRLIRRAQVRPSLSPALPPPLRAPVLGTRWCQARVRPVAWRHLMGDGSAPLDA